MLLLCESVLGYPERKRNPLGRIGSRSNLLSL